MNVYLVGALKNPNIPIIAGMLRSKGYDVFDEWFAAGEFADTIWRDYEIQRGRPFRDALRGAHAQAAYHMDKAGLDAADVVVLVLPAGKSAHIELGYAVGQGKRTVVFNPPTDRFDLMYAFADDLVDSIPELLRWLDASKTWGINHGTEIWWRNNTRWARMRWWLRLRWGRLRYWWKH